MRFLLSADDFAEVATFLAGFFVGRFAMRRRAARRPAAIHTHFAVDEVIRQNEQHIRLRFL
jgi:hypothetical protein